MSVSFLLAAVGAALPPVAAPLTDADAGDADADDAAGAAERSTTHSLNRVNLGKFFCVRAREEQNDTECGFSLVPPVLAFTHERHNGKT